MEFNHDQITWAADEVTRQKDSPERVPGLLLALSHAEYVWGCLDGLWAPVLIESIGRFVHNEANLHGFRKVNLVSPEDAVPGVQVAGAMARLCEHGRELNADEWVLEFLKIHPFNDGNGRVASVVWNVTNGTTEKPEPLPDFFH